MANHSVQLSSFLTVPADKNQYILDIVNEVEATYDYEDGDWEEKTLDICYEIEKDGIWFYSTEYVNLDQLIAVADALVTKLKLPNFMLSWAFVCDRPVVDSFGGGACLITQNTPPFIVDAIGSLPNIPEQG